MEAILGILLAFLLVGCLISVCFLVLIQPIWGVIDVATSEEHSGGVKAMVILLTVFLLGPIMTIGYALFGKPSAALRRNTAIFVTFLLVTGLSSVGIALTVPAFKGGLQVLAQQESFDDFGQRFFLAHKKPVEVDPGQQGSLGGAPSATHLTSFEPFSALHVVATADSGWSVSLAKYSEAGLDAGSKIPLHSPGLYPISQVALDLDGKTLYALTTAKLGTVSPGTGEFKELQTDPAIGKLSWPSAIAFDSDQRQLVIAGKKHGYSYKPDTGEWGVLKSLRGENLVALEYVAAEGVLYGLRSEVGGGKATHLVKMNPTGEVLEEISLAGSIPIGTYPYTMTQLCRAGDRLVVVVSDANAKNSASPPALFGVDPASGSCLPIETRVASAALPNGG